ncbi:UV-damaged DNA-binding protein rad7, partial [Coemansia aciculifera]
GPHSALTDYLQEIGVSRHFRDRRRAERAAAEAEAAAAGTEGAAAAGALATPATEVPPSEAVGADEALAQDLQDEEDDEGQAAALGVGSSRMAAAAAAAAAASKGKGKGKAKKKKKAYSSSEESDSYDDASKDPSSGLNRSSARKGGKMKDCSVCGRRFLMRTEPKAGERLLCVNCRRSVDKTQGEAASVAKRARAVAVAALPKRRRLKKTADGLLELEPGLPTLQDLCVQAIAKHVDQVESFGDLSAASLDKLCRIVCKMRVLDEHTLALFLGADRGALVLYDCTRLASDALKRIVEMAPNVRTLALEYCGRLDDGVLGTFGPGLEHLAS